MISLLCIPFVKNTDAKRLPTSWIVKPWRERISDGTKSMRKLIDLDSDILAEGYFGIYKPKKRLVDKSDPI